MKLSCEVCFKRPADRDGICNGCHFTADDKSIRAAKVRIVEQARITDDIVDELIRAEVTMTSEEVVARIVDGCFGPGYSARIETKTETVEYVHVIRYGRQQRGYIRVDDGELDVDQLDLAGIDDRNIIARLTDG